MFIYQYHTKILLVDISGDTQGKITNIKANIELGFDFKTYQASVETFDIKDSGAISLTFSGNGLLDWVTSRMTDAVTFFLHPIIIRIIEYMVKGGVEDGVKAINEVVGSLLNNGTSTYDYLYI
ncbi:hypothetical protein NQ317_014707 [Molorchus minor]|uniref:Uncharacterized protein n=1 Tax=Molorchus minor TaxID=1323400 RepID=A0ABQ9JZB4_9CUCU|nr:hypothetical protein NQ317_014707 [Molorchus minor]